MDVSIFFGDITEFELKKRLDLKIQTLQKQSAGNGINFELTSKDPIENLLNNLAYRCVDCDLCDSVIKCEIQKIMEEVSKMNNSWAEVLDESIQLDESSNMEQSCSNSCSSFNFNDTMDEIEQLLRDEVLSGNDNDDKDENAVESIETLNKPQVSNIEFEELENEHVSDLEVEQFSCDYSKNFDNEQSSIQSTSTEESIESKNNLLFKLPAPSFKKQILNDGGNMKPQLKISTPVNKLYKDVVSPVAFYIKNSGITPTRQKLKFTSEKHLYRNDLSESMYCKSETNNNFSLAKDIVLPEIVYKPSARKIVSHKSHAKIPISINKLVGNMPEIIIHEQRISKGERKPNIHATNPNYSVVNEDISIYVTKQAEIH